MPTVLQQEVYPRKIVVEIVDHSLPRAEEKLIRQTLADSAWNLKTAARLLHIARGTLYSKMKKYNITRPAR